MGGWIDLNSEFMKEEVSINMANKYAKRYSSSLVTRKRHTKITMK